MYSKEEKKELNSQFFKMFVERMRRHTSQGGGGRWESYRTGVKGLYFRMLTTPTVALAIDLQQKDPEIRALIYDQFLEFGTMLKGHWGEDVRFEQEIYLEVGVPVSRISIELPQAYFFDRKQWQQMLEWYEEKWLELDLFWEMAGDVIKELVR